MKLKKMVLHNFRQFFGKQELIFETSDTSNVIVIHGENGAGKTTILEAFSWCLYGKMDLIQSNNILNEKMFNDLPDGMTSDAKVVLLFEDRHKEYLVTRAVQVKRVGNQQYHTPSEQTFFIKKDGVEISSPTTTIDRILSKELKKYFFFDGERIDKLAKPESAKEIEDGIKNIMGIAVYERGIRHLKESKKILATELKAIVPEGEESPYEEEDKIQTELDDCKVKLKNNIKRKEDKLVEKEKLSEELKSVEALEKHEKLKIEKDAELEELNGNYNKLIDKEKGFISKEAYIALSGDLIFEMNAFLEEKREKGELPSGIREQFIQDLIDRGKCICGTSLNEGDNHVVHLKDLLTNTVKKSVEDGFLKLNVFTDKSIDAPQQFLEKLSDIHEQKTSLIQKIEKVTAELSDITLEMKEVAKGSNSSELILKRESIERTIEEVTEKIGEYKGKIKDLELALDSIQRAIEQHQTQNRQIKIAEKRIELCQNAIYQMEDIYEQLTSTVRKKLSEKVSSVFTSIVAGKDAKINHNFELEITKEVNGEMKKTPTSTGENQIASLAFISSLVNLAKEWDEGGKSSVFTGAGTYPVVMDSPFGALDTINRDLISRHVQSLAPQVIVFVSTSQWSTEVENNLKPFIQHEYILQYHNPNQEKFKTSQKSIQIDGIVYDLSVQADYEFTKIIKIK